MHAELGAGGELTVRAPNSSRKLWRKRENGGSVVWRGSKVAATINNAFPSQSAAAAAAAGHGPILARPTAGGDGGGAKG